MKIKPRLSQSKLAREAGVSVDTLRKAERGEAVTESIASAIYEVFDSHLPGLVFDKEVNIFKS